MFASTLSHRNSGISTSLGVGHQVSFNQSSKPMPETLPLLQEAQGDRISWNQFGSEGINSNMHSQDFSQYKGQNDANYFPNPQVSSMLVRLHNERDMLVSSSGFGMKTMRGREKKRPGFPLQGDILRQKHYRLSSWGRRASYGGRGYFL